LFVEHRAHWQDAWILKWPPQKQINIARSIEDDDIYASKVNLMVKREVLPKYPTKPRGIQFYPNLATQAKFGPEFFSLQKTYTEWFQRREVAPGIRVTFASGMNAVDLGSWMTSVLEDVADPHLYERDGESWDATMQRPHLILRKTAYDVAGDDFLKFVDDGFSVVGKSPRGALRYKLVGTVKSGHNDTTLGNSLVNAMIVATAMRDQGLRGDIIVAGDDLLAVIQGDFDEHALAKRESSLGIKPKYRKFDNPLDVSFISGVWFRANGSWVFTPKPGRLLSRLFWTVRPPLPKHRLAYNNGIAAGLRPTCAHMPIIGTFLAIHTTEGVAPITPYGREYMLAVWESPVSYSELGMMDSFCARYDLTLDDVLSAEIFLAQHAGKIGIVQHPVLTRLMEVDLADIADRPLSRSL
jgi:hypothetical protein